MDVGETIQTPKRSFNHWRVMIGILVVGILAIGIFTVILAKAYKNNTAGQTSFIPIPSTLGASTADWLQVAVSKLRLSADTPYISVTNEYQSALPEPIPNVLSASTGPLSDLSKNTTENQTPAYAPERFIVKLKNDTTPLSVKSPPAILRPFTKAKLNVNEAVVAYADLDKNSIPQSLKDIHTRLGIKSVTQTFQGVGEPVTELINIKNRYRTEIQNGRRKINEALYLSTDLSKFYTVRLTPGSKALSAVVALKNQPDVEYAELDYTLTVNYVPADTHYSKQWALKNTGQTGGLVGADIKAEPTWDITRGSANIIIGIIDTGVDYTHPDLGGCLGPQCLVVSGYNFLNNTSNPLDDNGHGSHVAGIIAAQHNSQGVSGICPQCKIIAAKVFDQDGSGYMSDAVKGIQFTVNNGAKVLNNSYGGSESIQTMEEAIIWATAQGVVFVAAAGNSPNESPQYPAFYKEALAVAATNHSDQKTSYSTYGKWVDVSAPGGQGTGCPAPSWSGPILSTLPNSGSIWDAVKSCSFTEGNGNYGGISGTSMAAPQVAGLAGLIFSKNPAWSAGQVKGQILYTADSIDSKNLQFAGKLGKGRINAYRALTESITDPQFSINTVTLAPGTEKWPNGQLDPGETPDIEVEIVNEAGSTANNVRASVSSNTPGVTVSANTEQFGSMPVGTFRTNGNPYTVTVAENIAAGTIVSFNLNFSYTNTNNQEKTGTKSFTLEVNTDIGFPKLRKDINPFGGKIVDLDLDGSNDIVIWSDPGRANASTRGYSGDGHLLWSFNGIDTLTGWANKYSEAAIGNVDADKYPEIVQIYQRSVERGAVSDECSHLVVLSHTGQLETHICEGFYTFGNYSPVLANIDGQGPAEILISFSGGLGDYHYVRAYRGDGTLIWNWQGAPAGLSGHAYWLLAPALAVGDLERDGSLELIVPMLNEAQKISKIAFLNAATGSETRPQLSFPNELITIPPAIADLDGDGKLEFIVGTFVDGRTDGTSGDYQMKLYVYNSDSSLRSGWPKNLGTNLQPDANTVAELARAIAANIDADPQLEILQVNSFDRDKQHKVYAFKANGNLVAGYPVTLPNEITGDWDFPFGILAANLDANPQAELIGGSTTLLDPFTNLKTKCSLWAYTGSGTIVPGYPKNIDNSGNCSFGYIRNVALGFLGTDQTMSLIGFVFAADNPNAYSVSVIDTGISKSSANIQWPYYGHDLASTSNYHTSLDGSPVLTPTPTPPIGATPTPALTNTPTPTPSGTGYSNLAGTLNGTGASYFNFTYSGASVEHHIDVSLSSSMEPGTYLDFGKGTTSPIVVGDSKKWTEVTCNKQLYWWVRQGSFYDALNNKAPHSVIMTATVTCGATATKTPTPTPSGTGYSNLAGTLNGTGASYFNFTYSGASVEHHIDVSLSSSMEPGTYLDFGKGTTSPIVVGDSKKWTEVTCNKQLYWWVRQGSFYDALNNKAPHSVIMTATVTCGATATKTPTPTLTKTPTPTPTKTLTPTRTPTPSLTPTPPVGGQTAVRIVPLTTNTNVGQIFDISLTVEAATNLTGADARLSFNPGVLEVIDQDSSKPGIQILGGNVLTGFTAVNAADNTAGTIDYVGARLGTFTGSGTLATIKFRGKANGSSLVDYRSLQLVDPDGFTLARSLHTGTVTVVGGATATPTLTPTPTPGGSQQIQIHGAVISVSEKALYVFYSQTTSQPTYVTHPTENIILQGSAGFTNTTPYTKESRPLSDFLGTTITKGDRIRLCTGDYSACSNSFPIF